MNDLKPNPDMSVEIFPWNENFSTGIPIIDEQHKGLVELLNRMAWGVAHRVDELDLDTIFNELANYAVFHFQTEEEIWNQFLTGDATEEAHKKSHENFVSELLILKNEKGSKSLHDTFEDIISFLTHWLALHILESDRLCAKVVLALKTGLSLEDAKQKVREETSGAARTLIDAILSMYDTLSARTLQLMKEIAERKNTELKANSLLKRNQILMDSTPEGVHILDSQGNIIEANDAFCEHLGYTLEEVLQLTVFDFEAKLSADELRKVIKEILTSHAKFESIHRRKDGKLVDVDVIVSGAEVDGQRCIFALSRDISERKQAEEKIRSLAFYDTLTELPNRRLLLDRLEQAMAASKRTSAYCALLFIDLDNFKPLNDTYGHSVGDLLLVEAAQRIVTCIREVDTVARFGGDEFVVALSHLDRDRSESTRQALVIAEKIRMALAETYTLSYTPSGKVEAATKSTIEYCCTTSIGVMMFLGHEQSADTLVKLADIAMYKAKDAGRNSVQLYDS